MLDPIFAPTFAITYSCDMFQYCDYCYAKDFALNEPSSKESMTVDDFRELLDWFIACDAEEIVLVGGEPPLHPNFKQLLDILATKKITARMFTNGFFPADKSEMICSNKSLNTLFFHYDDQYLIDRGKGLEDIYFSNLESARDAGKKIFLRTNFNDTEFSFEKLIKVAVKYDAPICYSFTTPAPGVSEYVPLLEYKKYLPQFRNFVEQARQNNIELYPARPLPLCMFDESELDFFYRFADLKHVCVAMDDLTINPDRSMQLCLVTFSLRTSPLISLDDLKRKLEYLKNTETRLHDTPSATPCATCIHFPKKCQGGCFAFHLYGKEVPNQFSFEPI